MSATLSQWRQRAADIILPTGPFIDGRTAAAQSDASFERINPATGRHLVSLPECGAADVDRAVAVARAAFEDGRWRGLPPAERKTRLLAWVALIRRHAEELALLETLDTGKPIGQTVPVDVGGCANGIAWYAESTDKLYDEIAPTADTALALITREPVGVVGAIVPWNYPLIIAGWKLGPALAAGNSVVLKPAEESSLGALRLAALAVEAGIPSGVFNVVTGRGHITGQALARHGDVDALLFTGSTEVGRKILGYSAETNLKRVGLELGGKSPLIVTAACNDLDKAATALAWSIWYNAGQTCHAASRLIVHRSHKQALLDKLVAMAAHIQPGDPLDPASAVGSLIDMAARDRILGYLDTARRAGADIIHGGRAVLSDSGGAFIEPTIVDGAAPDSPLACDEVFGPVLSVHTVDSTQEAIALANATPYGLAAAVFTSDLAEAHRSARALRAGTVWVNTYDETSMAVPFGGFKQSGQGRDRSLHALDKVTELKTTWIALG